MRCSPANSGASPCGRSGAQLLSDDFSITKLFTLDWDDLLTFFLTILNWDDCLRWHTFLEDGLKVRVARCIAMSKNSLFSFQETCMSFDWFMVDCHHTWFGWAIDGKKTSSLPMKLWKITMFTGKIHYRWSISIVFCRFFRPGKLPIKSTPVFHMYFWLNLHPTLFCCQHN